MIETDFQSILRGDFSDFSKIKEHFRTRPQYNELSKKEQEALEEDYKRFRQNPFLFPEEKVKQEIVNWLKLATKNHQNTKYPISKEEEKWLNSIDLTKEYFGATLSIEYISTFEKIHQITLPRDYKLFLNYIGNGFYRFRRLEQSLIQNETLSTTECFEFIDLTKDFQVEKQTQRTSRSGYLTIYDYGCGIVHYLIIKGEHYGKIWYQNPEFGDMIEIDPTYDSWIDNFRDFLKMMIGSYR